VVSIHEIYENSHDRQGLLDAIAKAGVNGAIILDNGHGYGFLNGEKLKDFYDEEIPYRDPLNSQKNLIEDGDLVVVGIKVEKEEKDVLVAILYLQRGIDPNIAKAAEISLRLYGEYNILYRKYIEAIERDPNFPNVYTRKVVLGHIPDGPYGLLMIDLDDFKKINDTYGHKAGDKVLQGFIDEVNKVLLSCSSRGGSPLPGFIDEVKVLPSGAFMARFGGEEFTVVIPGANQREVYKIADRINRAVRNITVQYNGNEIQITVSIGGGVFDPYVSVREAIEIADLLLYDAKNNGKDRAKIYKGPITPADIQTIKEQYPIRQKVNIYK